VAPLLPDILYPSESRVTGGTRAPHARRKIRGSRAVGAPVFEVRVRVRVRARVRVGVGVRARVRRVRVRVRVRVRAGVRVRARVRYSRRNMILKPSLSFASNTDGKAWRCRS
jgi:hypothetical protein